MNAMSTTTSHKELPETVVMKIGRPARAVMISICIPLVFMLLIGAYAMWEEYKETQVFMTEENQGLIGFAALILMLFMLVFAKYRRAAKISLTIHRPSHLFIYKDGDFEMRFFSTAVWKILYVGNSTYDVTIHLKSGEELLLPWQLSTNTYPGRVLDFLETYAFSLGIPAPYPKVFAK